MFGEEELKNVFVFIMKMFDFVVIVEVDVVWWWFVVKWVVEFVLFMVDVGEEVGFIIFFCIVGNLFRLKSCNVLVGFVIGGFLLFWVVVEVDEDLYYYSLNSIVSYDLR